MSIKSVTWIWEIEILTDIDFPEISISASNSKQVWKINFPFSGGGVDGGVGVVVVRWLDVVGMVVVGIVVTFSVPWDVVDTFREREPLREREKFTVKW